MKDFYLMGRGDLFREFIRLTAHILNKTPTNHTSRDINLAFQIAIRKMHLSDESTMDSFNFTVPIPEAKTDNDDDLIGSNDFSEKELEDPIGMIFLCDDRLQSLLFDIEEIKFLIFEYFFLS